MIPANISKNRILKTRSVCKIVLRLSHNNLNIGNGSISFAILSGVKEIFQMPVTESMPNREKWQKRVWQKL